MPRILLLAGAAAFTAICASATAQAATAPKPRSAASMECSSRADAKGLHGTARRHFRSRCMRDLAKAGKTKSGTMRGYH